MSIKIAMLAAILFAGYMGREAAVGTINAFNDGVYTAQPIMVGLMGAKYLIQ